MTSEISVVLNALHARLIATNQTVSVAESCTGGLLGAALTESLGVTATNFDNLALLLAICNLSGLLPLPFLYLLSGIGDDSDEGEGSSEDGSGA